MRGSRCAMDDIGDAIPAPQQLTFLEGRQEAIRETGSVECGPKAISRTGKVMPDRRGVKTRIDPAEKELEPRLNDVRHLFIASGRKLFSSWPPRFRHAQFHLCRRKNKIEDRHYRISLAYFIGNCRNGDLLGGED